MPDENVIEVNHYDGIEINDYNGKISLNSMQKGKNEVWYKVWIFLSRWKDGAPVPDEKKRPMSVKIGDSKAEAIETLKTIIAKLNGTSYPPRDEDIPF